MSTARKPHTKSHGGCKPCKDRRVKCDEERPSCHRCIKREEVCTYATQPDTPGSLGRFSGVSQSVHLEQTSSCSATLSPTSHFARLHEMYLMHWYSTEVFQTLCTSDLDTEIWQKGVPREAARYGFLTDGLLSISSLHLASALPAGPEKLAHVRRALSFQSSALSELGTAMKNLSDANISAVFGISAILITLPLALFTVSPGAQETAVSVMLSVCQLVWGSVAIMNTSEAILNSGMWQKILHVNILGPDARCNESVRSALSKLRARAKHVARFVEASRYEVYASGIDVLEELFTHMANRRHLGPAFAFPVVVNQRLVNLLQEGDPMAQLIWTHYGVLLLEINSRWWGWRFGVKFIEDLSNTLEAVDEEWNQWTVWPRTCAQLLVNEGVLPTYGLC